MRRALLLFAFCILHFASAAQIPIGVDGARQPRILVLLDASSSMLSPWGKDLKRFTAAAKVITSLMDSIYSVNKNVEFGLRVFGETTPAQENNCTDTRREVMFSKNNATQMALRLAALHPLGVSPIAYSLKEAASYDLEDEVHNAYSIILITDGGESCGGDICGVMATLIQRKIFFKPYIIGLADYDPKRDKYECFGTYLQATNEGEVPLAIHKITDDYRPMLSAPILIAAKPTAPVKIEPQVKVITTPTPVYIAETTAVQYLPSFATILPFKISYQLPVLRTNTSFPSLPTVKTDKREEAIVATDMQNLPFFAGIKPFKTYSRMPELTAATGFPALPKLKAEIIALAAMQSLGTKPGRGTLETYYMVPLPRTVTRFPSLPVVKADREEATAITQISEKPVVGKTVTATQHPVMMTPAAMVSIPKPKATTPEKPANTSVTIKPLPPVKSNNPGIKATNNNKPKEAVAITSVEDSKETTAAIYFTDGHGKFYHTSPSMQLLDRNTGKLVKQFYRTVGPNGEPDLQTIPPGIYNLMVGGRSNLITRNVVIEEKKNNKILIPVTNGSIVFVYPEARERPVLEFVAKVRIRFEEGAEVDQRCSEEIPYPPGNYYIEVNTLPITRFNADVDFGSATELPLPEPGFVQITNTNPIGTVVFWYPLGDKYSPFKNLDITGNPDVQKLRLRPGAYEVHWRSPGKAIGAESVQKFLVKPNALTEVELH